MIFRLTFVRKHAFNLPHCFLTMASASKRKSDGEGGGGAKSAKRAPGHWSLGLKASMEDPELRVVADDKIVIIKDKYPKVSPLNIVYLRNWSNHRKIRFFFFFHVLQLVIVSVLTKKLDTTYLCHLMKSNCNSIFATFMFHYNSCELKICLSLMLLVQFSARILINIYLHIYYFYFLLFFFFFFVVFHRDVRGMLFTISVICCWQIVIAVVSVVTIIIIIIL